MLLAMSICAFSGTVAYAEETTAAAEYSEEIAVEEEDDADEADCDEASVSEEAGPACATPSDAVKVIEEEEVPTCDYVSLGVFKTTAYCPCRQCSCGWGRNTSTGAIAQTNHTIAVDPRVIPYGTKVMINGIIYTAEDEGGGVVGKHIDIFFDHHEETTRHGVQHTEVFLCV